jgi:predicted TIM-barrel fold metal-dependent hydrolase
VVFRDGHLHVFPDRLKIAIDAWFTAAGWHLWYAGRSAPDCLGALAAAGMVEGAALVYAHRAGMAEDLNRWLWTFGRSHPELVLFGTVHPDDADLPGIVERALDRYDFAGFKIHANVQRVRPDDPRLDPLYEAVRARDRAVVIHAGREPHRTPYAGWRWFVRMLERFPGIRVQVAHLGYDQVELFADLLADHPGLYLDTAGLPSPRLPLAGRQLRDLAERWPDRIVFGSDMPILEEPVSGLLERVAAALGAPELVRRVFWDNAGRFWGRAGRAGTGGPVA